MAHINGPAVMAALNAAERSIGGRVTGGLHTASATSGPSLLEDFFRWGTGAMVKEMFKHFDRDRDRALSNLEYAAFCEATEGQGCDEKRWQQHCRSLGVADIAGGICLGDFGKLYTEKRFKRHFGKVRGELEKVKRAWTTKDAPPPSSGNSAAGYSAGATGERPAVAPTARRSVLRRGCMALRVEVSFTEPGMLGIEWEPEAVLEPPDAASEVLAGLQQLAVGTRPGGRAASVSRGDLHPKAAVSGAKSPPPGVDAFVPSSRFAGARAGYQFQLGDLGVGYYWDATAALEQSTPTNMVKRDEADADDDDDEVDFGCKIARIRPDSLAAKALAAAGQRGEGLLLRAINGWSTQGQETDDVIERVAAHTRSVENPLILEFSLPGANACAVRAVQKIRWADDDSTVYSTEDAPSDAMLDMFGGNDDTAVARGGKRPRTAVEPTRGDGSGAGSAVLSFHLRAQQELVAFAQQAEAAKARKARLEKVMQIGSRQEAQQQQEAAMAAAAAKKRAEAVAKELAESKAAGPVQSKWGLKRSREGDGQLAAYGGAVV